MASLSPPFFIPSPSSSSLHRRSTPRRFLSLRTRALSASAFHRWFQLRRPSAVRAQTFDFSTSFFEGGFDGPEDDDDDGLISPLSPGGTALAEEDRPEIPCPPGLRRYETMAVLRPDMTEDERLALTQKYEELLVSGGGMYVEIYNRGVIPLSYSIKKKNRAGEANTYLDGIYILFTYFTKPESMAALDAALKTDDDVIRSSSFKIRKRKYN